LTCFLNDSFSLNCLPNAPFCLVLDCLEAIGNARLEPRRDFNYFNVLPSFPMPARWQRLRCEASGKDWPRSQPLRGKPKARSERTANGVFQGGQGPTLEGPSEFCAEVQNEASTGRQAHQACGLVGAQRATRAESGAPRAASSCEASGRAREA